MTFAKAMMLARVVRDAEVRESRSGTRWGRFAVAVNDRRKDENGERPAHFFDCVVFGKTADVAEKIIRKGKLVFLEGELAQERWEDKDTGKTRTAVKVKVWSILDVTPSKRGDDEGSSSSSGREQSYDPADFSGGGSSRDTEETPF